MDPAHVLNVNVYLYEHGSNAYLAGSASSVDSVEGFEYTNTGTSTKSVRIEVRGAWVPGAQDQDATTCYDVV